MDNKISQAIEAAIDQRVFPGAVVGYVRAGQSHLEAFGHLTYAKDSPQVTRQTVYDIASLTKPIPTASLILRLVEQGKLGLDDKAILYLPELNDQYREKILIRHLLTYTVVFDLPGGSSAVAKANPDKLAEVLFNTPLLAPPGEKYYYTNPPAYLLGIIVERIYKGQLDQIAQNELFGPLGMGATTFHPEDLGAVIAPTELDWRGEVRGQIHDESAYVLRQAGQFAGNAGLFSTADDLLVFAKMLLSKGAYEGKRYFDEATVELMHKNQIANLGESTGLGWEINQPRFMGSKASPEAFSKTGFTGCFIMIDPIKDSALVLLSNSTYPDRSTSRGEINAVRRELADIIFSD